MKKEDKESLPFLFYGNIYIKNTYKLWIKN